MHRSRTWTLNPLEWRTNRNRVLDIAGGDGSTLSLDFTMGVLDSRITFTRGTSATYINSDGFVTSMGSAITNDPTKARFDYDPITKTCRGLLIEPAAVNLLNWSETFATTGGTPWVSPDGATLGSLVASPSGLTNAYSINETATTAVHRLVTTSTTGLSGAYSLSVWAKCVDTGTPRRLYINAVTALGVGALFDLTASGSSGNAVNVAGTAANKAGTWVAYPNGWYRCTVVGTRAADGVMYLQINRAASTTATDDTFLGSLSNGIIMWGAQLEAGSNSSSYIPTVGGQGNRSQDICYMDGVNFSSWFGSSSPTAGTLYARWSGVPAVSGRFLTVNNNGTSNQIWMGQSETYIYAASTATAILGGAATNGGKVALAYDLNTSNTVRPLNGSLGTATTTIAMPTGLVRMDIGNSQPGTANVGCWLREIKYWPTRLPDSTLQSLTT